MSLTTGEGLNRTNPYDRAYEVLERIIQILSGPENKPIDRKTISTNDLEIRLSSAEQMMRNYFNIEGLSFLRTSPFAEPSWRTLDEIDFAPYLEGHIFYVNDHEQNPNHVRVTLEDIKIWAATYRSRYNRR